MEILGGCRKCQRGPETSFSLPTFVLEKSLIYQLIGFKNLEHLPHRQQPTQPPICSYMGGLCALSSHTGCSVCRTGLLLPQERRKGEAGLEVRGRAADLRAKPERWAEQDGTAVTRRNQNQLPTTDLATVTPLSSVWVHRAVQSPVSSASYKSCFTLSQKFATLCTCLFCSFLKLAVQ